MTQIKSSQVEWAFIAYFTINTVLHIGKQVGGTLTREAYRYTERAPTASAIDTVLIVRLNNLSPLSIIISQERHKLYRMCAY